MLFIIGYLIYYIIIFSVAFNSGKIIAKLVIAALSYVIIDPLPFVDEIVITASTLGLIGRTKEKAQKSFKRLTK